MIAPLLLGLIVLIALVVGGAWFWSRFSYYRACAYDANEVLERAVAAERENAKLVAEYMFWKEQVVHFSNKPANVLLKEEQVMSIAQIVIAFIQQQTGQNPNAMN